MDVIESPQTFYSAPITGANAIHWNYVEQFLALDNMRWNHLRAERDRLAAIKNLPENWDGNGSAKPSEIAAVWASTSVLPALYDAVSSLSSKWSTPHITASELGEIVFEWWKGEKKITMYISESQIEYIRVWGSDIDTEMDAQRLEDSNNFRSAWAWLFA